MTANVALLSVTATGSTATRGLGDRLGEFINVKDFGAVGDGSNNDTSAIQAALNVHAAICGVIFFPPGTYKVTSSLVLPHDTGEGSFIICGVGQLSIIEASSFSDYVFKRVNNITGPGAIFAIEDLAIQTSSSTINGIRLEGAIEVNISRVAFRNINIGLYLGPDIYCASVRDCDFRGRTNPVTTGSIGVMTGCTAADISAGAGAPQSVQVSNCNIVNFGAGIQWACSGTIENCRFEANDKAISIGTNPEGGSYTSTVNVLGCGGEANYIGLYVRDSALSSFIGIGFQGSNPSGLVAGSLCGVQVVGGTANFFASIRCSGYFTGAGIDLSTGSNFNPLQITFCSSVSTVASGGGTAWLLPAKATGITFIQCTNPTAATAFSYLPGQTNGSDMTAIEGMQFDITDGAKEGGGTAALGDNLQGGGTQHLLVRYNGSKWTAVGK